MRSKPCESHICTPCVLQSTFHLALRYLVEYQLVVLEAHHQVHLLRIQFLLRANLEVALMAVVEPCHVVVCAMDITC